MTIYDKWILLTLAILAVLYVLGEWREWRGRGKRR